MNYIKHLTGFFNKSNQDASISPTHISLYLALFQRWNLNRFKNPIIISREEMMTTAKIKSKGTYHKCMKELHEKKYVIYKPSFNPYEGTEVILPDLSNICDSKNNNTSPNFNQTETKNELPELTNTSKSERSSTITQNKPKKDEVKNRTSSKNITSLNFEQSELKNELPKSETSTNFDLTASNNELQTPKNDQNTSASPIFEQTVPINELVPPATIPNFERTELKNSQVDEQVYIDNNKTLVNSIKTIYSPEEKTEIKKEGIKSEFIAPTIELVKQFFQEKKVSTIEAEKYFNYYSSKGWLVGGKTPMKDWKAAARNWILNLDKFNPKKETNNLSPKNLNVSNSKDYAEPL
ncbi:transcriptional regulator [Flavobacterium sp. XN-5]|uniref:transcriptional regulator n=1 Tax=Flavobacterium sp. XN-5 TaxID=2599390 RepID=UPI0011CA7704|nr:transcriptional regulator [Flavobacterium sp. XN-5]NGY36834.1 transcriptional regulator [Flavobacterium sp. XN-5]